MLHLQEEKIEFCLRVAIDMVKLPLSYLSTNCQVLLVDCRAQVAQGAMKHRCSRMHRYRKAPERYPLWRRCGVGSARSKGVYLGGKLKVFASSNSKRMGLSGGSSSKRRIRRDEKV
jgi:hypothetical protein